MVQNKYEVRLTPHLRRVVRLGPEFGSRQLPGREQEGLDGSS